MDNHHPSDARDTTYIHGYDPVVERHMASRTADVNAAFFRPLLHPGMRLLDCGCGPGTTTVGLAAVVAPGEVVGIDIAPSQIASARTHAAERGVMNVRFEVGDITALPFPDASFDAVFAHTVIQHVRDPLTVLREMHRILVSGGVIGLRDDDLGSAIVEPRLPVLERAFTIFLAAWEHNGGDPWVGRKYRRLLREAGFVACEVTASCETYATVSQTRRLAALVMSQVREPGVRDVAISEGWADTSELGAMIAEITEWGEHEDAFMAVTFCEGWGWKA
jgi:ubiquinone/menaquinone biosynthesis C-methylase UbiE